MIAPSPALPPPRQLHSAQIWLSDSDKRCSLPAGGADARPPSSGRASPRGPGRGPRPSGIPARRVRRCPRPSVPASPHTFPQLGKVRNGGVAGEGRAPGARTSLSPDLQLRNHCRGRGRPLRLEGDQATGRGMASPLPATPAGRGHKWCVPERATAFRDSPRLLKAKGVGKPAERQARAPQDRRSASRLALRKAGGGRGREA